MNMVCAPKHYYNQTPLYEMNYSKLLRLFRTVSGVCHRIQHPTGLSFRSGLNDRRQNVGAEDGKELPNAG